MCSVDLGGTARKNTCLVRTAFSVREEQRKQDIDAVVINFENTGRGLIY
jgi:hypothetical protein